MSNREKKPSFMSRVRRLIIVAVIAIVIFLIFEAIIFNLAIFVILSNWQIYPFSFDKIQ